MEEENEYKQRKGAVDPRCARERQLRPDRHFTGREENLTLIADTLGISISKVYSVATFYENFSLEAKGKHIIKVCAGTACHVRKSGPIYDAVHEYLGLHGKKKTSDDGLFTLETVACLGACGLAPVMTIDGEVHAKMDPETALGLLAEIRAKEGAQNG